MQPLCVRSLVVGSICVVLLLFAVNAVYLWPYTVDDAFISFRYAQNLSSGKGLTFNPGDPVEGYTNFLWVVLMALPHLYNANVEMFAKIAGIASALGTICLVGLFSWRLNAGTTPRVVPGPLGRVVAAFCSASILAIVPETAIHAVSGMETAVFTLLLISLLYLLSLDYREKHAWPCALAVNALLLGLTRPEGNLVAVVGLGATLVSLPEDHRKGLLKATLLFYVIPGAVYFGWRLWYFGLPLPLPFYLKAIHTSKTFAGLGSSLRFLKFIWETMGPLSALPALGICYSHKRLLPAYLSAGSLLVFYVFPAHIMGYGHRFLFPVFPFVCVLAGMGVGALVRLTGAGEPSPSRLRRLMQKAIPALVVFGFALSSIEGLCVARTRYVMGYAHGLDRAHRALGNCLGTYQQQNGETPLLAVGDAGAIPYFSRFRTIDTFGLNDKTIATSGRRRTDYVMDQRPDVVVLISHGQSEFDAKGEVWRAAILAACFRQGMVVRKKLEFQKEYYLWVLTRPGTKLDQYLRRAAI